MTGNRPQDWTELFINPDLVENTPAEITGKIYEKYIASVKAVVDSFETPVGLTPKELVWSLNKTKLYRYTPVVPREKRHPVPIILVYALINKPFVFDLIPGRSFIEHMVSQGFDMYLLDWGSPGPEDQNITLDDYVSEYLRRAVRKMLRVAEAEEFTMMGYCIGATLAMIYAAIYPEMPMRNLILLTAPLDFSKSEGVVVSWSDETVINVDKVIDTFGNVPGELIKQWAKVIRPVENMIGVYVTMLKLMDDEQDLWGWKAMHRWVEDVIPFAGEAFRQFVKVYIRENKLIEGGHVIDGRPVDVSQVRASFLNIVAKYDHLIPRSQSETIMDLISSEDKEFKEINAAHVGIMVGRSAKHKLWPEIVDWLDVRSR